MSQLLPFIITTVNLRVDPRYSDFYYKKTLIEQVDSFYIGQYAVTNREYCEFLNDVSEGGGRNPAGSRKATVLCQPIFTAGGTLWMTPMKTTTGSISVSRAAPIHWA